MQCVKLTSVLFVRLMKEHSLTFILLLQLRAVRLTDLHPVCAANEGTRSHTHPAITVARSASVLFLRLMKQYSITFMLLLQLHAVRLSCLWG